MQANVDFFARTALPPHLRGQRSPKHQCVTHSESQSPLSPAKISFSCSMVKSRAGLLDKRFWIIMGVGWVGGVWLVDHFVWGGDGDPFNTCAKYMEHDQSWESLNQTNLKCFLCASLVWSFSFELGGWLRCCVLHPTPNCSIRIWILSTATRKIINNKAFVRGRSVGWAGWVHIWNRCGRGRFANHVIYKTKVSCLREQISRCAANQRDHLEIESIGEIWICHRLPSKSSCGIL